MSLWIIKATTSSGGVGSTIGVNHSAGIALSPCKDEPFARSYLKAEVWGGVLVVPRMAACVFRGQREHCDAIFECLGEVPITQIVLLYGVVPNSTRLAKATMKRNVELLFVRCCPRFWFIS